MRVGQAWAYLPAFLPPEPFRSGAWVKTDPASFFAASVADFCCNTLPARLASSLDDFSFLLIAGLQKFRDKDTCWVGAAAGAIRA